MLLCVPHWPRHRYSIWFKLQETIKHWVKDVPVACRKEDSWPPQELTEKIDEIRVNLHAIRISVGTRTKSTLETIADTREHLHEELQVEIQTTKVLIEPTRREFHTFKRSQGQGRTRKNSNWRGCREATEVRWDYIMARVLTPVRDCSRGQLLDAPGEIHILDHRLTGPSHRHATRCPERSDI
jgi:hypothetical protein